MLPGDGVQSPEFELVLACVRWPVSAADAARIRVLAQQPLRWPHLLKIVHHHQVASLVSRNLEAYAAGSVPQDSLSALRTSAVQNAHTCFQGISELVRLTQLFREQQVELRVLKGAPLAVEAFGDATLRGIGDIDLLIRQADIARADEILRSEGYLRSDGDTWLTPRRMRSYIAHQKDFSYDNPGNGVAIDLHWRLFRNRRLPFNLGLDDAGLAWLQLGPERIPTLPSGPLFLYLCVHGALDGWLRLKWLADIAALLRKMSPEQLSATAHAAMERKILPEFSAAILLCQQMLGFEQAPAECLRPAEPTVARILRLANRLLSSNDYCPVRDRISSTTWFLNEFLLHSPVRYRLELIERSLFRPRLWGKVSLPDALFPLYALLSPLEWLTFRAQRLSDSVSGRWVSYASSATRDSSRSLVARLARLAPSDLALLAEAGIMLTFFRIALRFFSVQRLTSWMGKGEPAHPVARDEAALRTIRRVEWAVGATVRHSPFTFVCFPQSLAAYFMLRRRHIHSKMFYGVTREEQKLKAHTWIKVGDRTVVGGEAESLFTVLAIFP